MKIVIVILFLPITLLSQASLDQKITRDYENEKLSYIISDLDKRTNFSFRYNETLLPINRLSYSFVETPLHQVLKIIFDRFDLRYLEYAPGQIIIAPKEIMNIEQEEVIFKEPNQEETKEEIENVNLGSLITLGDLGSSDDIFVIKGTILDDNFFEPVSNVLLYNEKNSDFTTTDTKGEFSLNLKKGIYTIHITSLSHENISQQIEVLGSDIWEITMKAKAHYIDEVVISGKSQDYVVEQTISGLERLSAKEIKQLTSFMGESDLLKSLLTLAGVSSSGDGATGYSVRGGSIDQNLIKQDGAVIFNPSHILGLFSAFNADIISSSSLYKGHIPAYHGGRVSSVLDVAIKDANFENFKAKGHAGLLSSKISSEVPIINGKSSLLLSGRTSYSKWLLSQVSNQDVQDSEAQFYDFNIKYTHKFSPKTKFSGSYFQSFDKFQYAEQFGYSWGNKIASVQLSHFQNDNLAITLKGNIGELKNTNFEPEGPLAFDLSSGIGYYQAQAQALYDKDNHTIHTGIEFTNYESDPETLVPINISQIKSEEVSKENGRELAFYVNDQFEINDDLALDFGLRYSIFQQIGPARVNSYANDYYFDESTIVEQEVINSKESIVSYSGLEPRVSLRWRALENFSFKLSYNRLYQYIHLLSNTTTPTPVDIWQVSNTHIHPLQSDNYSIGIFHKPSEKLDYSVEVYYKKLDNTIDYREFADLILRQNLESAILLGEGRSFGGEVSLSKSGEKLSGRLSYSYSNSKTRTNKTSIETINNAEWYPASFNQPHEIKLFMNLKLSRRDRINVNFVYNTGKPLTAPIANYKQQGVLIPDFSDRNQFRLPSYHRLDFSYTLRLNRRKGAKFKSEVTLSVYNLYARKNAFSVFYRTNTGTATNALRLSVIGSAIPSITYGFQF